MKILCVISEVEDLTKTGGLADVGKSLPLALAQLGHDVRIVTPYYRHLKAAQQGQRCKTVSFNIGYQNYQFHIYKMMLQDRIVVYGVDYPDYFDRAGIYNDDYQAYPDNGQRFAFFSLASLYLAQELDFSPDIFHCHDWHTALACYFLEQDQSQFFSHTRSVLTIHNGAFQGAFAIHDVPLLKEYEQLKHREYVNFLEQGIGSAGKITAVSPNYAQELLTSLGSHGLDLALNQRSSDVSGILNGCDYQDWSPSTDSLIPQNYTADDLSGKAVCKRALQKQFSLPLRKTVPVIGMVCRLTNQKGFEYLLPALEELIHHQVQFVIVGTGDPQIVRQLESINEQHPKKLSFKEGFSQSLAHWVESGSDFFLMPSLFEPCGLNQMYSLAYGTIPIVRAVGGLKDTVFDELGNTSESTGFVFDEPSKNALVHCVRRALLCYQESSKDLIKIQRNGMLTRFLWEDSAKHYEALFHHLLN